MTRLKTKKAVSLFASGGIGDLAIREAGWHVIVANEILEDRVQLYRANYPETEMLAGDIRLLEGKIIERTKDLLGGEELDLLFATPPCQGMSKNGRGKLLRSSIYSPPPLGLKKSRGIFSVSPHWTLVETSSMIGAHKILRPHRSRIRTHE